MDRVNWKVDSDCVTVGYLIYLATYRQTKTKTAELFHGTRAILRSGIVRGFAGYPMDGQNAYLLTCGLGEDFAQAEMRTLASHEVA